MDIDLTGVQDAIALGWLATAGFLVRAAIVWGRPRLQKKVASEWPSKPWAGWLLTGGLAAAAAVGGELALGAGWGWALVQTAMSTFFSIATTPGMDAKTREFMTIFVKDKPMSGPSTAGDGTLDPPEDSPPAGPVDPPSDAGPA